ncbi:MAG: redox-sensing transcriptional repressor Rex [Acidimicrobiia bacterium]|nr:redox-sensing transcriptional repressor Rex [Acidimicrobiia bacterium]
MVGILWPVKSSLPEATVGRLPLYLRALGVVAATQVTVSSDQLADLAGVNSAQVRKDLSFLGSHGVRGVGYGIEELRSQIVVALGVQAECAVAIVGAGNLGSALANYPGFGGSGFKVAAILDTDPSKVGKRIHGITVDDLSDLEAIVSNLGVGIVVIATPAEAAQHVADRAVAAGVKSILNFAPTVLKRPDDVHVRRVDLSTELQILSFHLHDLDATA